jgi:kynurenine 3-monooxygenase
MLTTTSSTAKENVLIVGGGPCGFATALMLAKRGWTKITVLEKRPTADFYEPDKAFNYLIDGRGQKFTDLLGLTDKLAEIGFPNSEFTLTRIQANGSRKTLKLPFIDPNRKEAYWLPRRLFVQLLDREIDRNWQDNIKVLFNTKCTAIALQQDKIKISASTGDGDAIAFEPSLLIGCDGINSIVRNTLKEWDKSSPSRFEMKPFPSPSSGLRYKVLTLPPNFPIDSEGKERALSYMTYIFYSAFRDRRRSVFLGLFPLKNPNENRTANIVTPPDHQIWELTNGEDLYQFFEQAFPQLPVRQAILPQESEGGYFPEPQYCSGLSYRTTAANVLLLGDAVHCFPPDIGQGVNSALEDVCVLDGVLAQTNDDLSVALPQYESLRSPDVKALIRLAQVAYPWQYNQSTIGKQLWSINFFLRLVLSRILPPVFNPPAFFLIQNYRLSYQEIWSMAQRTTRILYAVGLILAVIFSALILRRTFI